MSQIIPRERIEHAGVLMGMKLHWFSPPVYVAIDPIGTRYAVSNIERAAEFLLSWRDRGMGPDWKIGVQTCMAGIKGEAGTAEARSAFEAAARECGELRESPMASRTEAAT
ncbi:MAG TPA: DUF982 domain-containing protein [Ensifer sp.]|jgi:hypothetical protein|uniref:DUF982 domain-containing protein n=1 Tax=Ensifer sp. TaxID=1872086 RepID=UPI002E129FFA|nr:DUF982 domain-containing protein [Ensifer sp.]